MLSEGRPLSMTARTAMNLACKETKRLFKVGIYGERFPKMTQK